MPVEVPLQDLPDLSRSYSCTAEGLHDIRHSCMWIIKLLTCCNFLAVVVQHCWTPKPPPWFEMYMHYTILLRIYKLLPLGSWPAAFRQSNLGLGLDALTVKQLQHSAYQVSNTYCEMHDNAFHAYNLSPIR